MIFRNRLLRSAACVVATLGMVKAQRGGNDWMTVGNDVQRSHWIRYDAKISEQTMRKPGFQLLWKMKMNNVARQQQALTSPALLDFYIGYRGFRTLGFFGGSGDTTIGVDTDMGRLEWQNGAGKSMAKPGTAACPGGMTSTITRPTTIVYPMNVGRGQARANPARSGVGEPFEGAVTLKQSAAARPPAPPPPPAPATTAANPRRATAPPSPFAPKAQYVVALTGDGQLHQMYVSNGEEPKAPLPFLKAGAHAVGLTVFDGVAYVATVNGCNGVENGVYAINLETKEVNQWKATGKNIAGATGFAVGPEGEVYAASGNQIVALEETKLKQRAAYTVQESEFVSSPVVFAFDGKNYVAATAADGKVHVVNAADMSSVAVSAVVGKASALASWEDEKKTRWILVPTATNVTALKLTAKGFETGWTSREIPAAMTPIVVNGVVFSAAPGNAKGGKAVLYAIDGMTGKEFWNSGTSITSYVTSGGLAAGGGRVYLSTVDNHQYAFGFFMEI